MKRVKCTTKRKEKKLPTRVHRLAKGMPRDHAKAAAMAKDGKDFRGFTYDPKSGKAMLT